MGKHKEAIECFDKALTISPDLDNIWVNKGITLTRLSLIEEALTCFEKAVELNPKVPLNWYNYGHSLSNLERFEESIQKYDRALALNPHYMDALNNKAFALVGIG